MYRPYKYEKLEEFNSLIKSELFDFMMENDREFRLFVEKNKHKAMKSIAEEYNLDLEMLNIFQQATIKER